MSISSPLKKCGVNALSIKLCVFFSLLSLLSGCGAPPGPPGSVPGSMPGGSPFPPGSNIPGKQKVARNAVPPKLNAAKPTRSTSEPVTQNPTLKPVIGEEETRNPSKNGALASMDKIDAGGHTIQLASAIITAAANPFMDKLPKPLKPNPSESTTGSAATVVAEPIDPFEGLQLMGIVFNTKKPMALLSVPDLDGAKSQMVRKGSTLAATNGTIKVLNINRDSVDVQLLGSSTEGSKKPPETRTISLPSIINFVPQGGSSSAKTSSTSTATTSEASTSTNAEEATKSNSPSARESRGHSNHGNSPSSGALMPALENLQKLTGSTAPSSSR